MTSLKMNLTVSLLVLCFYSLVTICSGEIYSSVVHIEESIRASKKLTEDLMTLARRENIRIPNIQSVYRDLKGKARIIKKNPESLISHPVSTFRFVSQLYQFFVETFHAAFQKSYAEDLIQDLPTKLDRTGTVTGILRLQEAYNQSTAHVSQGIVASTPSFNLSVSECYDIGVIAIEQGKETLGVEWLKEAWGKVPEEERKDNIYILKKLANATATMGSYAEAIKYANEVFVTDPSEKDFFEKFEQLQNTCHKKSQKKAVTKYPVDLNYSRLCADENWVNPNWQTLNCYVTDNGHPILKLRPVKVEEVKKNPDVVVFHDFVTDVEIEQIKFLTKSKLERSTIRVTASQQVAKDIRVSKGVFMKGLPVFVKHLKNRVAAATGLSVRRGSEPLQVVNYGVGGFYIHHIDAWHQKDMGEDNRIATVLMYLSDVQAGGATVFPYSELRIKAEKGSLAFWYNLHRTLTINHHTRHAACPVMVGSKWVANFWIHRYHNEFTRKCPLSAKQLY